MLGLLFIGLILAFADSFTPRVYQGAKARSFSLNMAAAGSSFPEGITVDLIKNGESEPIDFGSVLKGKKAVLFAVPGAFTPTCSAKHLPGFIENAAALRAKGIDAVYCLSVNDKFVMKSWQAANEGCADVVDMIADGNGELTAALGLTADKTGGRMGMRCTRFAGVLEDGVFKHLAVDSNGFENSSAEKILEAL